MSNSAEVASLALPRQELVSSKFARWQVFSLLLLIGWLYASTLGRLVLAWVGWAPWRDPNFQHGIFVPLFALFILWQDRKNLRSILPSPSWTGVLAVILSQIMLVLGLLGAEPFSARVSLLVLLAGLIVIFRGWTFFRAVLFPWAFLFLMIPIPTLIMNKVTFPLQLLASKLATGLLRLVQVPVLQEGNLLTLAAKQLDVAEACSGIRSLITMVTLSIIYGYLLETRNWVRVTLVCFAIPIAVAANVFRIFGTGLLVQFWDPNKAEGFYHSLGGELIFVVALIMLFAVHRVICLVWKSAPVAPLDSAPAGVLTANTVGAEAGFLRFGIVVALLLGTAVGLEVHVHSEVFPQRTPLNLFPMQIDGWTGTDETLDKDTLDILGPGDFLMRDYEKPSDPQRWINLWIAYFPTQRAGGTIHSPSHCLPGAGWIPTSRKIVKITLPDGSTLMANQYVVTKLGERELALYWYQAHGRTVASEYQAKYFLIRDSIQMNRSDGALVRLITPMFEGESADAAQARMMTLGSQFLPMLDSYIPR